MQFQDGRPKQKRHRCRNPNKIDVNSLTGEERVQIINRRNARKVKNHCVCLCVWLCKPEGLLGETFVCVNESREFGVLV